MLKAIFILLLPSFHLIKAAQETVLLVNEKPFDLEWENCVSTMSCIKANVIERVAKLESKIQNVSFAEVPEEKGTLINLSTKIKMKVIQKDSGKIAFRFVANPSDLAESRGHVQNRHQAMILGMGLILLVLGTITTWLKVNVYLALLGVAIGKILLFCAYTEHLLHKKHHHHHGSGLHIHRAPVHHVQYAPVSVLEHVPVYHDHTNVDVWNHHDHHDHHHDIHDHHHHDYHDGWLIKKKK